MCVATISGVLEMSRSGCPISIGARPNEWILREGNAKARAADFGLRRQFDARNQTETS